MGVMSSSGGPIKEDWRESTTLDDERQEAPEFCVNSDSLALSGSRHGTLPPALRERDKVSEKSLERFNIAL